MDVVMELLKRFFSIDLLIYAAIVLITVIAVFRCLLPLSATTSRLRRATKVIITENKQKKDVRSWKDLGFLGDRLQTVWADFLQNAEVRAAHGENCDVAEFINDETVIDTAGSDGAAPCGHGTAYRRYEHSLSYLHCRRDLQRLLYPAVQS